MSSNVINRQIRIICDLAPLLLKAGLILEQPGALLHTAQAELSLGGLLVVLGRRHHGGQPAL